MRDVSQAFCFAIENFERMKGQIFNIGLSDTNISKLELCQRIKQKISGFTILESDVGKDPDKRDYIVSNKKIEATGFEPRFSLDDGITELIKGYSMINNRRYGNI